MIPHTETQTRTKGVAPSPFLKAALRDTQRHIGDFLRHDRTRTHA